MSDAMEKLEAWARDTECDVDIFWQTFFYVTLDNNGRDVCGEGSTLESAISAALEAWETKT